MKSERERKRLNDIDRGSAIERGYDARWRRASAAHLRDNPLCAYCELDGRIAAATLTDHVYPQRRYPGVFWDRRYWASSCAPCHSGMKQMVERQGHAAIAALAARLGLPVLAG